MRYLWISGWAIPPEWFAQGARAAWPRGRHTAVPPGEAADALARRDFDCVGGYSLGALWLLQHREMVEPQTPVMLIAPILAFAAEQNRGGRLALTQLRVQRRRLRREPMRAWTEFIQQSGLHGVPRPEPPLAVGAPGLAALEEGLRWLEEWCPALPLPAHWRGVAGEHDLLVDSSRVQQLWPAVRIAAGGTHQPEPLLRAAGEFWP